MQTVDPGRRRTLPIVVQKYGGTSVGSIDKLHAVARKVAATRATGVRVVVVVSAMGGTTDTLLRLADRISAAPQPRELDMLLTSGERVSTALLAMALRELGHDALSMTGGQAGVITDDAHSAARVVEVRVRRLRNALDRGAIPVVAGFQGQSHDGEETTLGRGGSDTTAVALAAALGARHCDIYSDVEGVLTGDPRAVASAQRLDAVSYDEMLTLARHGARVLAAESVEFARRRGIELHVRSTFGGDGSTRVRESVARRRGVTGVAGRRDVVVVRLAACRSMSAASEALRSSPAEFDVLAAGPSEDGRNWLAAVASNRPGPAADWPAHFPEAGGALTVETDAGLVTAVGRAFGRRPDARARCRTALEGAGVEVSDVLVAQDAVSSVVAADALDDALRALHDVLVVRPALVPSEGAA